MPRFVRDFLVTGIIFGLCMGVCPAIVIQDANAVISTMIWSGLVFGLLMAMFAAVLRNSAKIKASATPNFEIGERIIYEGPANHFKGWEGVGGWLFLTSHRIVFKSHPYNIQKHTLSLPLSQIRSVYSMRTLGLIPNGLHIETRDSHIEKFVVENHLDWSSKITSARQT